MIVQGARILLLNQQFNGKDIEEITKEVDKVKMGYQIINRLDSN